MNIPMGYLVRYFRFGDGTYMDLKYAYLRSVLVTLRVIVQYVL